jgi:hypothetical protein
VLESVVIERGYAPGSAGWPWPSPRVRAPAIRPARPPVTGTRAVKPTSPASGAVGRLPRLPPLGGGRAAVRGVRAGGKPRPVRRAGAVFGGRATANAVVTWTLVGINVAALPRRAGAGRASRTTGRCSGTRGSCPAGRSQGVAAGSVVPADHVRVPAAGPGLGGLGLLDIAFNMWALILIGPSA